MQIFLLLFFLLGGCYKEIETRSPEAIKDSMNFVQIHHLTETVATDKMENLARSLEKNGLVWKRLGNKIEFKIIGGLADGAFGRMENVGGKVILIINHIPDHILWLREFAEGKINAKLKSIFDP